MITQFESTTKIRQQAALNMARQDYAMLHGLVIRFEKGLPGAAPAGRMGV